ncbi:hypothetical protein F5144DRAFT_550237 [Chaetomium tenue]|uniref:Uncharacterized protein n=1 Tax=Chaetomium tenue TaxID=1854479 RepID=A0ACB7NVY2_9PEZI|nr:hypothetical protein F5144DRAFT_550237 [Chaetomium globosum]
MTDEQSLVAVDICKKEAPSEDASPDETKPHPELEMPKCQRHEPGAKLARNAPRGDTTVLTKATRSQDTCVFSLPLEVFHMIWDYLTPEESKTAFALTCRLFYRHFKVKRSIDREILQLWLEKDIPKLYWCPFCSKLHTWCCGEVGPMPGYEGRYPARVITSYDKGCKYRKLSGDPASPGNAQNIKLETVRLIINRHLYGEAHGLSPDALSFTRHRPVAALSRQKTSDIMIEESRRLRVIDGELYVRENSVLYHKEGDEHALRAYLNVPGGEDIMPPVCRHIASYSRIDKTKLYKNETGGYGDFVGPILSCRHCYTDYHIRARWHPADGHRPAGWAVGGTKWCALGACRDLSDRKWLTAAMEEMPTSVPPRATDWCAGMVLSKWADGGESANVEELDLGLTMKVPYPSQFVG